MADRRQAAVRYRRGIGRPANRTGFRQKHQLGRVFPFQPDPCASAG